MKKNNLLKFTFLGILLILFNSCSQANIPKDQPNGFIQIKGSDTIVNAAQQLAEEFMKSYPYIYIGVTGGGSGVGVASLINKTCDIATLSREIKPKELAAAEKVGVNPKEYIIAYDGIAIIINKNNPIEKLTIKQLHDIYTGKITNWQDIGGQNLPIVGLSREVNSGTHTYFKEEVVQLADKKNKDEFAPNILLLSSSQAIVEETSQNPSAIGYLGMGYVSDKTKTLKLAKTDKFYAPSIENVLSKQYPLSRPLYIYTNGQAQGIIKIFIDFIFSKIGQEQFIKTGFVPLKADNVKTN